MSERKSLYTPERREQSIPIVTDVIRERVRANSEPGKRKDPFKVAMILEGGAMRSVIVGGEALALSERNLINAFDSFHAVSAGAPIAAYALAGQGKEAISIYWENINNNRYINFLRFFKGEPIIDIRYATHDVMVYQKPLDWKRVADSEIPLHIYVTSAKNAQVLDINKFDSQEDLLDALHWTMRLPFWAGKPTEVNGEYFADGGLVTGGIPLEKAIDDGASHILVLLSGDGKELKPNRVYDYLYSLLIKRDFPVLAEVFTQGVSKHNESLRKIRKSQRGGLDGLSIDAIEVSGPHARKISRFEKRSEVLILGARQGYKAALEKFNLL